MVTNYEQLVEMHGGVRAAAKAINMPYSSFHYQLSKAKADTLPVVGITEQYEVVDSDGTVKRSWIRRKAKDETTSLIDNKRLVRTLIDGLKAELPAVNIAVTPPDSDSDLLTLYTVSDLHVGAYAWAPETGADWDLTIARETALTAMANLIEQSPPSKTAILNLQGDYFDWHYQPLTPTNKHVLDTDGRSYKVLRVGTELARSMVDLLLRKHERVEMFVIEGNHDMVINDAFSYGLELAYEKHPRVTVHATPSPHKSYVFGDNMLGFTHGHLIKFDNLAKTMAYMFPTDWGRTKHHYFHAGHNHHLLVKECPFGISTQHPTITAPNAYATRNAHKSARRMLAHVYHNKQGELAVMPYSVVGG